MTDLDTAEMPDLDTMPPGAVAATPESQEAGRAAYNHLQETTRRRTAPDPADAALGVEFYRHPVDGLDHVRIRIPGDKLHQPDFVADDHYKLRFARQWHAYQQDRSQFEGQTMLEQIVWIDHGMKEHLAFYGVKTLEGLAAVPDGNLDALGHGMRALRDKAKKEIEARAKAKSYDALKAEMDAMKAEMDALQAKAAPSGDDKGGSRQRPASDRVKEPAA